MAYVEGIDVSRWQGKINWDSVADTGIRFSFIKATERQYTDIKFKENWANAKSNGIIRGAYIFYQPGDKRPLDQIDYLLKVLGDDLGELPIAIDAEVSNGVPPEYYEMEIVKSTEYIEKLTKKKVILYTSRGFWSYKVNTGLDLWVASWREGYPILPPGFTTFKFWQYRVGNKGEINGIATKIDRNKFNGNEEQLQAYAIGINPPNPLPIDKPLRVKVLVYSLRIRNTPSITGRVLGGLYQDTIVEVDRGKELMDNKGNLWLKLKDNPGYIAKLYEGQTFLEYVDI